MMIYKKSSKSDVNISRVYVRLEIEERNEEKEEEEEEEDGRRTKRKDVEPVLNYKSLSLFSFFRLVLSVHSRSFREKLLVALMGRES